MKTINILLITLVAVCIASCTKKNADNQQHQIETMNELLDSLSDRDIYASRTLYFTEDSVGEFYMLRGDNNWPFYLHSSLSPRYCHLYTRADTTEVEDRSKNRHIYMLRAIPETFERLCKKAKTSWRYQSGDSLDYSITMGNNPLELLSMTKYKEKNSTYIGFTYNVLKPWKKAIKSDDVRPVRELLKTFIAEQKGVKKYEVKYEWDKGVSIPRQQYEHCLWRWRWILRDCDSLAASSVTGTHFFIPAKDKYRIDVAVDFYNRLNNFAIEHPQIGVELNTTTRLKTDFEKHDVRDGEDLLQYSVCNDETHRNIYNILMKHTTDGIHILELYTPNTPRFTIPYDWYKVKESHNLKFDYEWDFAKP